jgi:hypothetical protein
MSFREICVFFFLACSALQMQAASGLVAVGSSGGQNHFIDSATVRQEGKLVRYRLIGRGVRPEFGTYSAEVGVDCLLRTRIEYLNIRVRYDGQVTKSSASSNDMFTVYKGTSQDQELSVGCQLATSVETASQVPQTFPGAANEAKHDLEQQQRNIPQEELMRQQAAESRLQTELLQQQQQDRDRARLEKEKCLENATERLCYLGCIGERVNGMACNQMCKERERANVAACNGIFFPPVRQQIIIQQGGGDPNPFPNMNKCIKDGGTLMCR